MAGNIIRKKEYPQYENSPNEPPNHVHFPGITIGHVIYFF